MNKLIDEGLKRNIEIEVFKVKDKCTDINSLNEEIKLFQITDVTSYLIKAIKNERCIKIVTENLNNTEELIDTIEEIFNTSDNKNTNRLCKGNFKGDVRKHKEIDFNIVKEDLISLNTLKKKYPCIKTIEGSFSYYENAKSIVNSNCNMDEETYFCSYGAAITVEEDVTRILYVGYFTKDYDFEEFKEYLLKRLDYLLIKLNSESVKTDKYKVLLTNNVVENILSTFSNSFHSKGIYLKKSILTDKLNKKIFSDKITIVEDSPKGLENSNFDSEGTIKNRQVLVDKGVFKQEVNNLEYAIKLDRKPTGNADGINNLYIEKGTKSFEELVKMLDNGIIIDEAYGFHAGVDIKTGNISVQAEGLLVENGKITKGLNMIILSTNFFEVFTSVLEVGSDLSKTSLSVNAPSILLENITITGKE